MCFAFSFKDRSYQGAWAAGSMHETRGSEKRKPPQSRLCDSKFVLSFPVRFKVFSRAPSGFQLSGGVCGDFRLKEGILVILAAARGIPAAVHELRRQCVQWCVSSGGGSKILVGLLKAMHEEIIYFLKFFGIFAVFSGYL